MNRLPVPRAGVTVPGLDAGRRTVRPEPGDADVERVHAAVGHVRAGNKTDMSLT
ncbi:hypothetical protein [Streptomyces sp. Tu 2975]|uniref:hypothetical protein n=1 Tax=Streptomyces sp. Tu 2975 TaxID=2676871 RepID=UPI001ABEC0AE|nr:hypothetical protein [Streptomyces sp. Tu 2975]